MKTLKILKWVKPILIKRSGFGAIAISKKTTTRWIYIINLNVVDLSRKRLNSDDHERADVVKYCNQFQSDGSTPEENDNLCEQMEDLVCPEL